MVFKFSVNIRIKRCTMIANVTNIHYTSNEVVVMNDRQLYGFKHTREKKYRMIGYNRPRHEKYKTIPLR